MLTGAAALTYLAGLAAPAAPRARQRAAASR